MNRSYQKNLCCHCQKRTCLKIRKCPTNRYFRNRKRICCLKNRRCRMNQCFRIQMKSCWTIHTCPMSRCFPIQIRQNGHQSRSCQTSQCFLVQNHLCGRWNRRYQMNLCCHILKRSCYCCLNHRYPMIHCLILSRQCGRLIHSCLSRCWKNRMCLKSCCCRTRSYHYHVLKTNETMLD